MKIFYNSIYTVLGDLTPLKGDCGRACNKACCEGDKDGDGMYLFPGEEEMYTSLPDWAAISETDFEYETGKFAPLFSCDGICDRELRPLSCRIFPLTPYVENGKLRIITDPRSKSVCPLGRGLDVDDYDRSFVKNVRTAFVILSKNKEFAAFLEEYSRYLDDYLKFFPEK